MIGSLGGGLFKTAHGAVTLDMHRTVDGLSEATVGTVTDGVDMVGDAATTAWDGTKATTGELSGTTVDRKWRADTPNRWKKTWEHALRVLEKMPYPPPHLDFAKIEADKKARKRKATIRPGEIAGQDPF